MTYVNLQTDSDGIQWLEKDPDAQLDFMFDWAGQEHGNWSDDWLQPGEVISSHTIEMPANADGDLILDSDAPIQDQKAVIVWLSGGTVCESYDIVCRIVTNLSRTDDRTMRIKVRER